MRLALAFLLWSGLAVVTLATETADSADAAAASQCRNPEVRKEWRTFTKAQKAAWIAAVNCLSKKPHSSLLSPSVNPTDIPPVTTQSSYYDDLVYIHMDLNVKIHFTGQFLPWHRWYVWAFTSQLKNKCGYTGVTPYWDWSKDSTDFEGSNIWEADLQSGLGGWGDPNRDYAVPNGGFRNLTLAYPSTHTLRRHFTPRPYIGNPFAPIQDLLMNLTFSPAQVASVIQGNTGNFSTFQYSIEIPQGMHSSIHVGMGGDHGGSCPSNAPADCTPGPTWSPNDPIFFQHHANVDRLWWLWQQRDPRNANAFFGGSKQNMFSLATYPNGEPPYMSRADEIPTDGLFAPLRVKDVINTQGGPLCYIYA